MKWNHGGFSRKTCLIRPIFCPEKRVHVKKHTAGGTVNGELGKWCGANPAESARQELSFHVLDSLAQNTARGPLPALNGAHASRPWEKAIRQLTQIRQL